MNEKTKFDLCADFSTAISGNPAVTCDSPATYRDYYEFAGLTASAWCEALKISPATHKKYLSGALAASQSRLDSARSIAFAIRAAATGLLSLDSLECLRRYEAIKKICDVEL